jgi:hypothetical protein
MCIFLKELFLHPINCQGAELIDTLTDSDIAELLATAAESAKQPLQKALRRASRRAFLWPEEAATLVREDRSLEELAGIGPSLSTIIGRWVDNPPDILVSPRNPPRLFHSLAGEVHP